jgi:hypothetical protein
MVRPEVMKIAKEFIKEDKKLLRKLAEEHKYLKR